MLNGLAHHFWNVAAANVHLRLRARFQLNFLHMLRRGTDKFLFHFGKDVPEVEAGVQLG